MKNPVFIYHRIHPHDDFATSAHQLFDLVQAAARKSPSAPRHLILEIDGHRNAEGGFDKDAFEIQAEFLMSFLMQFLTEAETPFGRYRNKEPQSDGLPDQLYIHDVLARN